MRKNIKKGIIILLGIFFIGVFMYGAVSFEDKNMRKGYGKSGSKTKKYENIILVKGQNDRLKCIVGNSSVEFKTRGKLDREYSNVLCDIKLCNNKVYVIKIKPYKIRGKILAIDNKSIEVEKYGRIKITDKFKVYKKEKESYSEISKDKLVIGETDVDFILENEKICAAIVKNDRYKSKDIRVLLKTSNYSSIFHKNIIFSSNDIVEILYVDNSVQTSSRKVRVKEEIDGKVKNIEYTYKVISPNKKINISPNSKMFSNYNRIIIRPKNKTKGIIINSIKRVYNNRNYMGQIEVLKTKKGLVIINDLDIETYLYSVVPSEMPESYGKEALKVQAICARTYAYSQLNNKKYKKYGANIDDSISYQVYNNQKYSINSIDAVNDTKGLILKYNNQIAQVFYYSTSCGYSSNTRDVFGGENIVYLPSKKQVINLASIDNIKEEINKQTGAIKDNDIDVKNNMIDKNIKNDNMIIGKKINNNISENEFRKFILSTGGECFEKNCEWFRWKISWNVNKINKAINCNIEDLCKNGKNKNIYVYDKKAKRYICKSISNIGRINNIKVSKRASGGVVKQIIIYGSVNTIKVNTQYTIRKVLGPINTNIMKNNYILKSKIKDNGDNKNENNIVSTKSNNKMIVKNMSMLPSSYFIIDKKEDEYVISGGGYGHGIGMSQCGVRELVKMGMNYKEIINYYFTNVELDYY